MRTEQAPGRTAVPSAAGPGVLLGVVLLALNLRAAIAVLSPLLPDVQADLGLGNVGAGLLTALPVLCFGLFAPLAALLGRRVGVEVALLAGMLGIVAGSALRVVPGIGWMFAGTLPSARPSPSATSWCRRWSSRTSPTGRAA
ncbi:hypothetical protein [Micromonospora sp. WMMD1082]|uniref:hypothetical protein n=1 Tax=Micromonospora sp. WMMD1082 TaxID=3016104 RepID=UPI00241619E0|nr:hypothetical protein [Micromonospora sp. WMMD1082]MDG4797889.1 hypothetical protein [Micromonospora sp. WMMD1082]